VLAALYSARGLRTEHVFIADKIGRRSAIGIASPGRASRAPVQQRNTTDPTRAPAPPATEQRRWRVSICGAGVQPPRLRAPRALPSFAIPGIGRKLPGDQAGRKAVRRRSNALDQARLDASTATSAGSPRCFEQLTWRFFAEPQIRMGDPEGGSLRMKTRLLSVGSFTVRSSSARAPRSSSGTADSRPGLQAAASPSGLPARAERGPVLGAARPTLALFSSSAAFDEAGRGQDTLHGVELIVRTDGSRTGSPKRWRWIDAQAYAGHRRRVGAQSAPPVAARRCCASPKSGSRGRADLRVLHLRRDSDGLPAIYPAGTARKLAMTARSRRSIPRPLRGRPRPSSMSSDQTAGRHPLALPDGKMSSQPSRRRRRRDRGELRDPRGES
jgi:hypothetical protein